MFSLFHRKLRRALGPTAAASPTSTAGLTTPQSAKSLLATPHKQKLLEQIWQCTAVSRPQFDKFYLDPIRRYAELVQFLPASESQHHAYSGGMLDHGLEVITYALKMRPSRLLPSGAQPEVQIAQAEAWNAALAYASLGENLGKIAIDVQVEYSDGCAWHPWHGPLTRPYRFRYRKDREHRLRGAASCLMIQQLLSREILDWLSAFPELWASLIFHWSGHSEHTGELGALITQADQASVAKAMGSGPINAMSVAKHALRHKLLDSLRYLLASELKLNQPQAPDGWLTREALWLVSKNVSDKLHHHLLSQGVDGVPEQKIAVLDVLLEYGIVLPTADGEAIWKVTVTSDRGWSQNFTVLKLLPALIWNGRARPVAFTGKVTVDQLEGPSATPFTSEDPAQATTAAETNKPATMTIQSAPSLPDTVSPDSLDSLRNQFGAPSKWPEDSESAPITERAPSAEEPSVPDNHAKPSGEHFMEWLIEGVRTQEIIMNDDQALVHSVEDTLFLVTPGIFQRYAKAFPHFACISKRQGQSDWEWVQRRFGKMKLHRIQANGRCIWTCELSGARRTRFLHGYFLKKHYGLISDSSSNNPNLKLVTPGNEKPQTTLGNTR